MKNQLVEKILDNAECIFEEGNTVRAVLWSDDDVNESETAIAKDNGLDIKQIRVLKQDETVTKIFVDDMALHIVLNQDVAHANKNAWQEWQGVVMSVMTNREYEEQDYFESRYEACYDTALDEFKRVIEPIKQSFEHHLDDTPFNEVEWWKMAKIVKAVEKMDKLSWYVYQDDYDNIEYDFYKELKAMLLDEYGFDLDEKEGE